MGRIGAIIGPTYGGWILTKVEAGDLASGWTFYAFAIPAVIAAAPTLGVPRPRKTASTVPSAVCATARD